MVQINLEHAEWQQVIEGMGHAPWRNVNALIYKISAQLAQAQMQARGQADSRSNGTAEKADAKMGRALAAKNNEL